MKILKTAAIIVAAVTLAVVTAGVLSGASAAWSFGALASMTLGAGGLGLSAAASVAILGGVVALGAVSALGAIMPQPSGGGSQTKWKADPYAGVPYIMGRTGTSGNIVAKRGSGGSNTYEHFVTVLSGGGPIHAIEASFANRTTVDFDGSGNATGTYSDRIWQRSQLGRCPEPAALTPGAGVFPDWNNATSKLSGMAAILTTLQYDGKGKTTFTTEPQMFWILQGVYVYDPRLDSTYPGGSGACRAFDETTYVYSEDPHLHGLTWAMGRYQNGKRVCGIGARIEEIDVASFVEGANLNDARGWKIGGQVVTRPDAPWSSLKSMLQAGGAQPALVGGLIICINRYPRVSLAMITGADIVGDCSFAGTQPRRSRINGVIPMYRSEAHDWEVVTAAGVIIEDYVAIDGDERTKEIQYSLVQDVTQATQLATYDVCDAREAGPGTVPLGPWWLNYRIGDCVTFNPEDGFLIKVLVTGRDLDAQTGTVTYTIVSETDGKHALALGATGVAPPTASIVYTDEVAAPVAGSWTATGGTLTNGGVSTPALIVAGAVDNQSADAVIVEYRVSASVLGTESGDAITTESGDDIEATAAGDWLQAGTFASSITGMQITSVASGTYYDVAISYRVRGVIGDRLIFSDLQAGVFVTPGGLQQAVLNSWIVEVTAGQTVVTANADGSVTIANNTRRYPDGHPDVAVAGATIASGLAAGAVGSLAYDDPTRVGGAVTYVVYANDNDAHASAANPGRHYMGYFSIPTTGSAGGGGGGVSGGRLCVTDDTPILMADDYRTGAGMEKVAADVKVGDWVWTQHEVTMALGAYQVIAIAFADEPVFKAAGYPRATAAHLFWKAGGWVRMDAIGVPDGTARIAKITVDEAHTYISAGVLSHNIKAAQP